MGLLVALEQAPLGQTKTCPDIVINQRLHRQFIRQIGSQSLVYRFASISKRLERFVDLDNWLSRGFNLAGYSQDLLYGSQISHVLIL